MKSFLFVIPSLKNTSPIKVSLSYANNLAIKGHDVSIFVLNKSNINCSLDHKIKVVGWRSLFDSYDYIHTHCLKPNFLLAFLTFFKLIKSTLITTVHTNIKLDLIDRIPFGSRYISYLWRLSILQHDIIFCLNEENKNIISLGDPYLNEKIYVIPNGIDGIKVNDVEDEVFLSFIKKDPNAIILGSACVLRKVKRIDIVLSLLHKYKNIKFVLIGMGPEYDNLRELSSKYGINDRVLFLGFKDSPNDYMSYVDIAVFPSLSEGFPLSLVEAMSLGIPCITSDIDAFKYFFNDEIKRFKSIEDFYLLINSVYQNRSFISNMVTEKYANNFTINAVIDKYLLILKNHDI
ncbi:glycosyltransferase family 4 protein [Photobacterium leiognathi]|uniref:glycosyltransferase family 4 protein n=1 Tax=Photobacterium leiognathi TaxID=553611 RepID=UPI002980E526|nr:glycosyltransferase family 4 protein [Photobacterium leiognathi]